MTTFEIRSSFGVIKMIKKKIIEYKEKKKVGCLH